MGDKETGVLALVSRTAQPRRPPGRARSPEQDARGRLGTVVAVPLARTAGREAGVQLRHAAVQEPGQQAGDAGRGADIDRRPGLRVGLGAGAIREEGFLAGVRAGDLVADLGRARVRDRDRAGADDLALLERLVEARERAALGAGEAQAPVALRVGAVRGGSRTVVEGRVAARRYHGRRQAEGAHHVAVVRTLGVHRADVLALVELEREADAVAGFDVALAVGDLVKHEAAGHSAERVGLVVTDLEDFRT